MRRVVRFWRWFLSLENRSVGWQIAVTVLGFAVVIALGVGLQNFLNAHTTSGFPSQFAGGLLRLFFATLPPTAGLLALVIFLFSFMHRSTSRRDLQREVRQGDPELFQRLESDVSDVFEDDDSHIHA